MSMAAADAIYANSQFHRDSLARELPKLLGRAPDHAHVDAVDPAVGRISVLPVGVELSRLLDARREVRNGPPRIVWNQRWEYDKDPERFFEAVLAAGDDAVDFELVLAGENVRVDPREFDHARAVLGDRVVHVGYLPRTEYCDMLLGADVVVSTARQEFFGIAMVEAMAAGAVPLLPRRLSYPEIVPERYHAAVLYDDDELEVRLATTLRDIGGARQRLTGLRESMRGFDWKQISPRYDDALDRLVEDYGRSP
jgi:glycosyltransferase involved in cell wall biosynthesis